MKEFYYRVSKSERGVSAPSILHSIIIRQYRDYQNGIPPTSEFKGRGAQNPRLLACFQALTDVENGWEPPIKHREQVPEINYPKQG